MCLGATYKLGVIVIITDIIYAALLSLYTYHLYILRCFKFTVNDHCTQYNLATNDYLYQYTSVKNISLLSNAIQEVLPLIRIQGVTFICELALNLFLCNFALSPCNLTTGTLKPICSQSCFFFRQNCNTHYDLARTIASFRGFPFADDCDNTLRHLQLWYNIEVSSDDFGDDCLDFGLESKLINLCCMHVYMYACMHAKNA